MSYANSIAFWGLLTLFIPLIIHLLNKRKSKKVFFGSIVFLVASESPSAKSIRLSDVGLMLLRMLILALIVFVLAVPAWKVNNIGKEIYVDKNIVTDSTYQTLWDELEVQSYKVFEIGDTVDIDNLNFPSYYTLIQYLNDQNDSSVVYTQSLMKDFKGKQVLLSSKVKWQILPLLDKRKFTDTISINNKSYKTTYLSDEEGIKIKNELLQGNSSTNKEVSMLILSKKNADTTSNILKKSLEAVSPYLPIDVKIETNTKDVDWVIMIDTIVPVPFSAGRIFWETYPGQLTIKKLGLRSWKVNGPLNENTILTSDLFPILSKILIKDGLNFKELDLRQQLPETIAEFSDVLSANTGSGRPKKFDNWFWFLIIVLIGLERFWVAKKE